MWRINLFSHLEILYCNAPAAISLRGRKTGGLLAYLAVYSYRSHPREALAAALWDEDNADERGSLRASLAALRNKLREADLPDTLLCIERDAIRLNMECTTTDVTAFREHLQAAKTGPSGERRQQLECAIALYRGPLLAAFTEAWVHEERERLAASHQAALAELASLCWNAGDYEQALAFSLRATHTDPDDESAHLRLMQFYVDMGRTSDALRQFRKLEYRVTRLGSPVSQAARALLERAQSGNYCKQAARRPGASRFRLASCPPDSLLRARGRAAAAARAADGRRAPADYADRARRLRQNPARR